MPAARSVFPLPPLMLSDSSAFSCLWMINRWQICFIGTSWAELSQCHFWHRCHREENRPSYLSLSLSLYLSLPFFFFFPQLCDSLKINHWKQCRLLLKTTSLMSEDPPDKVVTEEHAVLGVTQVRYFFYRKNPSKNLNSVFIYQRKLFRMTVVLFPKMRSLLLDIVCDYLLSRCSKASSNFYQAPKNKIKMSYFSSSRR